MDHEAYENEMMDVVNRHGEAAIEESTETAKSKWSQVVNKNDARVVASGLKRTILALLTAAIFAASVIGFIKVATASGYIAVALFFGSILGIIIAFTLLYAQGITNKIPKESSGDNK